LWWMSQAQLHQNLTGCLLWWAPAGTSLLLSSSHCSSSNASTFYLLSCWNPTCGAMSIVVFYTHDTILHYEVSVIIYSLTLKSDSIPGNMNNISCLHNVRLAL
jgi:hypothetical protein